MNPTDQNIEQLLRKAPKPAAPSDLKQQLIAAARQAIATQTRTPQSVLPQPPGSWLRRWWPVLLPGALSLGCAAVLTMQQIEIGDVQKTVSALTQAAAQSGSETTPASPGAPTVEVMQEPATQAAELARLRAEAARLRGEIAKLEQVQADNARLRGQLALPAALELSPEEAKAKEEAMCTACANNLKQLGLAAKTWALDNTNVFPQHVLEMTNEMSTPRILVCPADTGRQPAGDWSSWSTANMSYEYLGAGGTDGEPNRVLFRCPIHGNVLLFDGSVQREVGKMHPDWLVQKDGKLYLEDPRQPNANPAAPAPSAGYDLRNP
ncbi:MAG TPA: hypothetical protein VG167_10570 [Verrucomicrobiae bacterium]|nr:hypothetical protein [Verrucomicrobiae bacterium]